MEPIGPDRFARLFAGLSEPDRAAFVAALRSARGWDVTLEDRTIRATRDGSERTAFVGTPPTDLDVDEIVVVHAGRRARTLARERDARIVDAAQLRTQLLYAIDRDRARALFAEHFGRDLRTTGEETAFGRLGTAGTIAIVLVGLGVVALLASGVALTDTVDGGGPVDSPEFADTDDGGRIGGEPSGERPPGLSGDGVEDLELLVFQNHKAMAEHRSATMTATFEGPRFLTGFDTQGPGWQPEDSVRIEVLRSGERYRTIRLTNFTGKFTEAGDVAFEAFGTGDTGFARISDGDEASYIRSERTGEEIIHDRTRRLLVRYLDTNESTVSETSEGFRVVATGEPAEIEHTTREYRAEATVGEDGLVTALEVRYVHPGTNTTVRVGYRYENRSDVTVSTPEWYEQAREET